MAESRARENDLHRGLVDAPAGDNGRWVAKDHISHLAWWRENNSAKTIDAIRTGSEPPHRVEDDNVQNAAIYAATKELPISVVKENANRSWVALERAVAACTEQELLKEHPRSPGFAVWELVPAHAGHVGVHVMSWLLDQGDVERARAAALWAHGVETESAVQPGKRADADYNLACFYARIGNPEEALPLLSRSFDAKRELVAWARQDTDLDPIRANAALRELLAS